MKKNIFTVIILIIVLALLAYVCYGYYKAFTTEVKNPIVTMEIEGYGVVEMELYPDQAPNTVKNFINLIQKGYYNGKVFSGLDSTCIYAGRDADGEIQAATFSLVDSSIESGTESDIEYSIKGEFVANGYEDNVLKHEKGVLSMCRVDYTQYMPSLTSQSYDSANAQFSILLKDERGLNGMYAAFGKVISGMEIIETLSGLEAVVDKDNDTSVEENVANTDVNEEAATDEQVDENAVRTFVNYPVIKTMTVDTFGVDYGMPEVEEAFDYYNYMYNYYSSQYSAN